MVWRSTFKHGSCMTDRGLLVMTAAGGLRRFVSGGVWTFEVQLVLMCNVISRIGHQESLECGLLALSGRSVKQSSARSLGIPYKLKFCRFGTSVVA